eukprot:scaffold1112_cov92-Amphora_coffeaeformis.AAC.22
MKLAFILTYSFIHSFLFTCYVTTTKNQRPTKTTETPKISVGKTSLMNRFASGKFTGQYKATIGADFLTKDVIVTDVFGRRHVVTLQIWDTAGQERFQSLGVGFYRGSDAAVLVYDVTDTASLDHLPHWQQEFLAHVGGGGGVGGGVGMGMGGEVPFPFVVVGNKADKTGTDRKVPPARAQEWCQKAAHSLPGIGGAYHNTGYGAPRPLPHYEASAKTAMNVEEVFQEVARLALQYEDYRQRTQPPKLFVPPTSGAGGHQAPIDLRHQQSSMSQQGDNCC